MTVITYLLNTGSNSVSRGPAYELLINRRHFAVNIVYSTDLYHFIQIPYGLFESYVHRVAADKLVYIPTKMAANSVERC